MNLNDRLDRVRDEVADEVASDVRVPSFEGVLARRARRRRLQAAAGGAALVVVAAGVVGGVAATRSDASRSVPPAATVSASRPPTAPAPTTMLGSAQGYPPKHDPYVVVPRGYQFYWTDLATGASGQFGFSAGGLLSPSVSADGRRVAYVLQTDAGAAIGVRDLDTDRDATVATSSSTAAVVLSAPSISPDGTKVIWTQHGAGVELATIGEFDGVPHTTSEFDRPPAESNRVVAPNAQQATWDGNDALAYLPADRNTGGQCAVMRLNLSAGGSERCLLPTATLQSVFAADGSTWQVDRLSGSADGSMLALGVTTTDQKQRGIGLLRTSAEATPFRVVPSTVTTDVLGPPVLIDGGAHLLYQAGPVGGNARVVSVDVATGTKSTVAAGILGSTALGLGATSG